jgi:methyl-accepting chemotaxis protein
VPSIGRTSDLVQEIAAASAEQTAGVNQITTSMTQMSQITQQNASSSEELAATAEQMMSQTSHLQQLMHFFTIEGARRLAGAQTAQRPVLVSKATGKAPRKGGRRVPGQGSRAELPAGLDDASFDRF